MRDSYVSSVDSSVAQSLDRELQQQRETLNLVASSNHLSLAVLEAQGSVIANERAEGYPGSRYFAGCQNVSEIEQLAIDRAKELFRADHANVQPHSGTQSNMAVYVAMLDPGDRILSLELTHGGHLSHGKSINFSGQYYEVEHYHVDEEDGRIDYDALERTARDFDPDMIISGFSAYPRQVEWERIQSAADTVDAYHMADIAHITGLVATGEHPSPVGIADFVTGSTHKSLRAGRGGMILCDAEYAEAIDSGVFPGSQGDPMAHNIAGKAVGFKEALDSDFKEYAATIVANAKALAETLREYGLDLVSGGTDTHLLLVDLRNSHPEISGNEAADRLEKTGLILNANTVPGETRSALETSGIRIGTPAITTRGLEPEDMSEVGRLIVRALDDPGDPQNKTDVEALCAENPLYETHK